MFPSSSVSRIIFTIPFAGEDVGSDDVTSLRSGIGVPSRGGNMVALPNVNEPLVSRLGRLFEVSDWLDLLTRISPGRTECIDVDAPLSKKCSADPEGGKGDSM